MGITIHYKGKLNSSVLIHSFLDEMEDIAQSMEWEYTCFPKHENKKIELTGLFIKPHTKSEFLQFMIDEKGFLRNALAIEHFEPQDETTFINHTKTQYSPNEIHIAIIKLLKYLKKKYISNLEVMDEGDYWNTGDAKILQEKFDFLNKKMYEFGKMLNSIEFDKNDTSSSVADKIETLLKNRWKKNNKIP